MKATKDSWKVKPMPERREKLPFEALYTDTDADKIMHGFIPSEMEDKWFIYFEQGWLFLHRSWTGYCIYKLKLGDSPAGVRVIEAWVNRDIKEYNYSALDISTEMEILSTLIQNKLINNEHYEA